jgi:thioredoxin 1
MEHTFTDANFSQEVLNETMPVLVDFWAEWCGPCRMMAPVVDELAHEFEGKMKIGKMNVDQNQTPGQFSIMSIPTFLIFKGGKVVDQMVGGMSKDAMKARLEKHL